MNSNFIKTSDKDTAIKLEKAGFTLLNKNGNVWTFINDGKALYSNEKIIFTNKIEL